MQWGNEENWKLFRASWNIEVKIRDVAIDKHFFVQDSASYPVIFGEPYVTPTWIKIKLLNNRSAYAEVN